MALDPVKLAEHVQDSDRFEFPLGWHWDIPQPFEAIGLHLTKFMVLELVAAVLMLLVFIPFARRMRHGGPPRGRLWNALETILLFVRDEVVRPAIGRHDADRFLPFIWTLFFFILFCNLLGMLPWAGSPTGSFSVTAALALIAFIVLTRAGMGKYGPVKFWLGFCPPMDLPPAMRVVLVPMILVLEIVGLMIRHCILAVRLLANMFAGHFVLAMILGFILATANSMLWYGVTPAAILGGTAVSLLELFVAFLQAYIFAFLTALFIGMAIHQH